MSTSILTSRDFKAGLQVSGGYLDLNKLELRNARIQNLATAPSSPVAGQVYYDTDDNRIYYWDSGGWQALTTGSGMTFGSPTGLTVGGSNSDGVGTSAARNDHVHSLPGYGAVGDITAETSFGASKSAGTANLFARADHTHGTPAAPTASSVGAVANGANTPAIYQDATGSRPAFGTVGRIFVDTTTKRLQRDTGAAWEDLAPFGATPSTQAFGDSAAAGSTDTYARIDHKHAMPANPVTLGTVTAQTSFGAASANGSSSNVSRADHTHGTPAHDASAHSSIKISDLAAPSGSVAFGSQKITGLADGAAATDAATWGQVQGAIQGLDWKASVRVVATGDGTLASAYANGQTVDGQTLATGDRILLAGQSAAAENGIYTVNASGAPTRATDADASGEISKGTVVPVEAGTAGANTFYYCTATGAAPWVPGSSTSTWSYMFTVTATQAGSGLTASGNILAVGAGTGITVNADDVQVKRGTADGTRVPLMYAVDVGDGASTSITVTHNLGTRDVHVALYLASGTYEEVEADVLHATTSTVTLGFATAPTAAQYRAVVMG